MKKLLSNPYVHIIIAIISALTVYFLIPNEPHPKAPLTAAMIILMAVLWITEAIPIPVTSLIPLFFLPLIGVAPVKEVSPYYARSIVFLFLGGLILLLCRNG